MYDIPRDLDGDSFRTLARALDAMLDVSEDVIWSPESASYTVEDKEWNHICLE